MARTRTVHVHTGPTLSAAEVHAVLPGAVVHPPVAATDLLRLPVSRGDVVVIIDGYFHQAQAVRHKEILLLLERGVEVWGTASMGALRAAELHTLGMRGSGAVFRLFTSGLIDGDDEVGVTHGPAERGYPILADALVNIRYTLRRLVRDGLVGPQEAAAFQSAAAATPFERRTPPELVAAAVDAGMDADVAERIGTLLVERRVDVKKRDALLALRRIGHDASARSPRRPAVVSDSAHVRLWNERCRVTADPAAGAAPVTDRDVLAACQLHAADYPEFAAPVALRALAALVSPPPLQVPADAELLHAFAPAAAGLDAFLAAHHLVREELLGHLREEHRIRAAIGDATPDRLVLDAADAMGVFAGVDAERWTRHWLRPSERSAADRRLLAVQRALAIAPGLPVHEAFVVALKLSGRFAAGRDMARAALSFNEEVHAAHPDFAVHLIDGARVASWYAERWSVDATGFDVELAARGFADRDAFLAVARPTYMAARFGPLRAQSPACATAAA
jgi:hypothetical protein